MGGKNSAPPPPDYTPIAQADATAAALSAHTADNAFKLSEDQLQWGKDQFNSVWPYAQQYLGDELTATEANQANATDAEDFYKQNYRPLEKQFIQTASDYNTPARADANAGAAMSDVSTAFNAQRTGALQTLESYGIDPSQTRYGALDLSTRISQAAATAAAGTKSRLNTEATGLALQGEAINIGKGYPGNVAQSYNTATSAGSSGIGSANGAINTGVNAQGSPTSYFGSGISAIGEENQANIAGASALNLGYNNALQSANFNRQNSQSFMSGIGQLIGGGAALLLG